MPAVKTNSNYGNYFVWIDVLKEADFAVCLNLHTSKRMAIILYLYQHNAAESEFFLQGTS